MTPRLAVGQLISPGELSAAHADLDGIRNCRNCHELRQRGAKDELCLTCHEPLAALIAANRGYHATVTESCASCHKEHGGRGMDIVRFDSLSFEHEPQTGFALTGAHAEAACRDCHTPPLITTPAVRIFKREHGTLDKTFLGLGTGCLKCHTRDDPHDGQFGRTVCSDCHGQSDWKPAPGFDHDRARYRLTGRHRQVECEDCHTKTTRPGGTSVQFRPLAFGQCSSCHADFHKGSMGPTCTDCHSTRRWGMNRAEFEGSFDHSRTGFDLEGAHDTLQCASCHDAGGQAEAIQMSFVRGTRGRTYARPIAEDCGSCHVDQHKGAMGPTCTNCHDTDRWDINRSEFEDTFDHSRTGFKLTGVHDSLQCKGCHDAEGESPGIRMSFDAATVGREYARPIVEDCLSCHVDQHQGAFADAPAGPVCSNCHGSDTWLPTTYDLFRHNEETAFELTGPHLAVPCRSCHEAAESEAPRDFTIADQTCAGCHVRNKPHAGQFAGRPCADCHTDDSFEIPDFDHDQTRYPLDGAHSEVPCAGCHVSERRPAGQSAPGQEFFIRYAPLETACRSCHEGIR